MLAAAILLVLFAVLSRILPTLGWSGWNLAPFAAIAFCGAVYVRRAWFWMFSLVALELSDVYLNWFHAREFGFHWDLTGLVIRTACFGAALLVGTWVARRKSWLNLLNGGLLGAVIFYLVTNTQSWASDPFYAKTLAGWWQALTVGHPEYPPTIFFFRNTLLGDLMFTGLFAGVMEWIAQREGKPSLLDSEPEPEEEPAEAEVKE